MVEVKTFFNSKKSTKIRVTICSGLHRHNSGLWLNCSNAPVFSKMSKFNNKISSTLTLIQASPTELKWRRKFQNYIFGQKIHFYRAKMPKATGK